MAGVGQVFTQRTSETDMFMAANGQRYYLSMPPVRFVMSEEGTGMPPISYITQRGPYQNGVSLRDVFLEPRVVQLIVRHNYCDRAAYWAGRSELLAVLAPNLSPSPVGAIPRVFGVAPGVLRKVMPGGITRDLNCIIEQGPKFEPRNTSEWDEWSYAETLRFIAHDPVYFDPTQKTFTMVADVAGTFPLTFPFSFVDATYQSTLTYNGNWPEYPTINVNGPISGFAITNLTTGQTIAFNQAIPDGKYAIIDLTYGRKTVTLNDGTNIIGYITPESNLAQFQLVPGANLIMISGNDLGPIVPRVTVTITYYERYIGI